jgi:hypothetical protein
MRPNRSGGFESSTTLKKAEPPHIVAFLVKTPRGYHVVEGRMSEEDVAKATIRRHEPEGLGIAIEKLRRVTEALFG